MNKLEKRGVTHRWIRIWQVLALAGIALGYSSGAEQLSAFAKGIMVTLAVVLVATLIAERPDEHTASKIK